MISNSNNTELDEFVKKSLKSLSVVFDATDWNEMEILMDKNPIQDNKKKSYLILFFVVSLVFVFGYFVFNKFRVKTDTTIEQVAPLKPSQSIEIKKNVLPSTPKVEAIIPTVKKDTMVEKEKVLPSNLVSIDSIEKYTEKENKKTEKKNKKAEKRSKTNVEEDTNQIFVPILKINIDPPFGEDTDSTKNNE